jgi:hypothetical protein
MAGSMSKPVPTEMIKIKLPIKTEEGLSRASGRRVLALLTSRPMSIIRKKGRNNFIKGIIVFTPSHR